MKTHPYLSTSQLIGLSAYANGRFAFFATMPTLEAYNAAIAQSLDPLLLALSSQMLTNQGMVPVSDSRANIVSTIQKLQAVVQAIEKSTALAAEIECVLTQVVTSLVGKGLSLTQPVIKKSLTDLVKELDLNYPDDALEAIANKVFAAQEASMVGIVGIQTVGRRPTLDDVKQVLVGSSDLSASELEIQAKRAFASLDLQAIESKILTGTDPEARNEIQTSSIEEALQKLGIPATTGA